MQFPSGIVESVLTLVVKDLIGVVFVVIALGYMWLAKLVNDKVAGFDVDDAIGEKSNLAVALRRAGFYLAIPLGMYGAIIGPSSGFLEDIGMLLVDGLFVVAFLFIARFLNDKLIVYNLNNTTAIRDGNVAVGLVEFGGYLATGLIAEAAFAGTSGGPIPAVVFFAFGQLVLLAAVRVYQAITPWNVLEEVRKGNCASGLMLGGVLLAISIATHDAISGGLVQPVRDITLFLLHAGVAIAVLMIASVAIERLFLPNTNVRTEIERDQNIAAITVVVAVKIAVALMINAAVV